MGFQDFLKKLQPTNIVSRRYTAVMTRLRTCGATSTQKNDSRAKYSKRMTQKYLEKMLQVLEKNESL